MRIADIEEKVETISNIVWKIKIGNEPWQRFLVYLFPVDELFDIVEQIKVQTVPWILFLTYKIAAKIKTSIRNHN